MSKATRRYTPEKMTRSDLVELTERLKRKSASTIFERLGVKHYMRYGSSYATPGVAALQGLPRKAPVRVINLDYYYSPEELVDIWCRWGSDSELERITR
jgi:hypothetical protein